MYYIIEEVSYGYSLETAKARTLIPEGIVCARRQKINATLWEIVPLRSPMAWPVGVSVMLNFSPTLVFLSYHIYIHIAHNTFIRMSHIQDVSRRWTITLSWQRKFNM